MNIKNFLLESDTHEFDFEDDLNFFTRVGELLDSLSASDISEETKSLLDTITENIIDILLSLNDKEFDEDTDDLIVDILLDLGVITDEELESDIEDEFIEDEELEEALAVKHRKIKSGKKRSKKSLIRGKKRLEYLKKLRAKRKMYKKNAMLKRLAKKRSKKYRRTARARILRARYKSLNRK